MILIFVLFFIIDDDDDDDCRCYYDCLVWTLGFLFPFLLSLYLFLFFPLCTIYRGIWVGGSVVVMVGGGREVAGRRGGVAAAI